MSNINWNISNMNTTMYVNNNNTNDNNPNQATNSQINAILLSNTNTIDQNNNSNNNNLNSNKLEDKKRQLHLPLGDNNNNNNNNDGDGERISSKRLKLNITNMTNQTPGTLTPIVNLDTPSLITLTRSLTDDLQLPTPLFETKIGDLVNTPVYTLPFTFQTTQQTPDLDVGNKLQRALEDVKRKDTCNATTNQLSLINYQMQMQMQGGQNQNQNQNYAQLTNVQPNIYLINHPDPKLTGNVIIMPVNQQQQQSLQQTQHQLQQAQADYDDKKLLNLSCQQPFMIGKEEPQTVPVHSENGTEHLTTLTNATSTTSTTTIPTSSTNTSRKPAKRVSNKLPSSNSSSPHRRNTRSSSTSSTLNQSSQDQLSISPIDLDHQEAIKVEKKRERNREAARKCRTRKLEKIAQLEGQVKDLSDINTKITDQSIQLKEEINRLRSQLQEHRQHGCEVNINI